MEVREGTVKEVRAAPQCASPDANKRVRYNHPVAVLEVGSLPDTITRHEISQSITVIGRVPPADVVIDAAIVSREHAAVHVSRAQSIFVEDLGSSNGVSLGGEELKPRVMYQLKENQKVSLGQKDAVTFSVRLLPQPPTETLHSEARPSNATTETFADEDETPPPPMRRSGSGPRSPGAVQSAHVGADLMAMATGSPSLKADPPATDPDATLEYRVIGSPEEMLPPPKRQLSVPKTVESPAPVVAPIPTTPEESAQTGIEVPRCTRRAPQMDTPREKAPDDAVLPPTTTATLPESTAATSAPEDVSGTVIVTSDPPASVPTPVEAAPMPSPTPPSVPSAPAEGAAPTATVTRRATKRTRDDSAPAPSSEDQQKPPSRRAPPVPTAPLATAPLATAAEATVPAPPPPLAAVKKIVWQYKCDLRKGDAKSEAWQPYSAADSTTIETGYQEYLKNKRRAKTKEVVINPTYGVHFIDMVQFRQDDRTRQRAVRRIEQ